MEAAKKVIKKIVSNTNLTSGANFGLMEWEAHLHGEPELESE